MWRQAFSQPPPAPIRARPAPIPAAPTSPLQALRQPQATPMRPLKRGNPVITAYLFDYATITAER